MPCCQKLSHSSITPSSLTPQVLAEAQEKHVSAYHLCLVVSIKTCPQTAEEQYAPKKCPFRDSSAKIGTSRQLIPSRPNGATLVSLWPSVRVAPRRAPANHQLVLHVFSKKHVWRIDIATLTLASTWVLFYARSREGGMAWEHG